MQTTLNWTLVDEASTGGGQLPVGAYVAKITDVEDHPRDEYVLITWDVAEGEHAGHYSDDFGKANPYTHPFRRYYSERSARFFKSFLVQLEQSNRGRFSVEEWSRTQDERAFVGLEIGVLVQTRQYTNTKGEDKSVNEVRETCAAQDVRNGDYRMPAPLDQRKKIDTREDETSKGAYYADDSVPF